MRLGLVEQHADRLHYLDVLLLVVPADVVRLAGDTLRRDEVQRADRSCSSSS